MSGGSGSGGDAFEAPRPPETPAPSGPRADLTVCVFVSYDTSKTTPEEIEALIQGAVTRGPLHGSGDAAAITVVESVAAPEWAQDDEDDFDLVENGDEGEGGDVGPDSTFYAERSMPVWVEEDYEWLAARGIDIRDRDTGDGQGRHLALVAQTDPETVAVMYGVELERRFDDLPEAERLGAIATYLQTRADTGAITARRLIEALRASGSPDFAKYGFQQPWRNDPDPYGQDRPRCYYQRFDMPRWDARVDGDWMIARGMDLFSTTHDGGEVWLEIQGLDDPEGAAEERGLTIVRRYEGPEDERDVAAAKYLQEQADAGEDVARRAIESLIACHSPDWVDFDLKKTW